MGIRENKKKEPWRIIAGIAAAAFIVYMWDEKDVVSINAAMPGGRLFR